MFRLKQPDNSITQYEYNPIGERTRVIDADGYKTTYNYDMFGNCVRRDHPDAGKTRWTYAPNGFITRIQTARLGLLNDSIRYKYCFDKLMHITYPVTPLNSIHYQYDIAGRVAYYEDATGSTRLFYDRMGNVTNSIRRIVVPTENQVYTFRTISLYDSFGRIRCIVYPDAEQVNYNYYLGGGLESVWRKQYGFTSQPILDNMEYDPIGHNVYRRYGNNVVTEYEYEPYRNRLSRLRTISPMCLLQDINYTYDGVGNIIDMAQTAVSYVGMGGVYTNTYQYDNQYHLTKSGCTIGNYLYDFEAAYSPAGRLGNSIIYHTGTNIDANTIYGYDDHYSTHQPRVVYDYKRQTDASLFWDANGNLAQVNYCGHKRGRFHDWDEENRLRMVVGSEYCGFYGYDANGERVYKLAGMSSLEYVDTHETRADVLFDNITLYPNPYITITPNHYTKHYYANNERFATVIGGGGFGEMVHDVITPIQNQHEFDLCRYSFEHYSNFYPFEYHWETYPVTEHNIDINNDALQELQYACGGFHLSNLNLRWTPDMLLHSMEANQIVHDHETEILYTHNNHLGSAAWITRNDGKPIQYIHYLPYGQLLANQMLYGYDERFKFIGKERDWESGYDYFGARYYISQFMHFASVEPLLDKYLHISPYSYAAWNPIKYYDFNGNHPQTGRPGQYQNGMYKVGADATFMQQRVQHQPQKMSQSTYFRHLSNVNKGTISASPTPKENLLNSLNTFEGAMIQSPVIQGTAAGLLTVGGAIAIGEAASMATPTLLETGVQLQGLTLNGINLVGESSMLQVGAGGIEGYWHSKFGLSPDVPHFSTTPWGETGYMGGQIVETHQDELMQRLKSFIDKIINLPPPSDLDNQ